MTIKINNQSDEIWKPIRDYEGLYSISNFGRIKRERKIIKCKNRVNITNKTFNEKILMPKANKFGYLRIGLTNNGVRKYYQVHRLVFEAFIGKISDGYEIDHINTIRTDNRLSNLRMVTVKENRNNNLTIEHYKLANTITAEKRKRKVLMYDIDNNLINEYNSIVEAAEQNNIHFTGIAHCCKGDFNKYKNHIFKYK